MALADHAPFRNNRSALTAAHLLAFAVSFAMVGVCSGLALQGGADALTVVTARQLVAVLLLLAWFRLASVSLAMPGRDLGRAVLIALPLALNNYLINAAFVEIPVPLAVLIFYLWPALATAASWALGREPFRWRTALGLGAAFAGVALALNVPFSAAQMKGVALALGAALSWTAAFLLTGHFFHGRDTRVATLYMSAVSLVIFLVACLAAGGVRLPEGVRAWAGLAAVGFFYVFALIGLFAATVRVGPMRTGFYMNFEPVAAVLLGALVLGQTLAPVQLAGAAMVVGALFLFRPPPGAVKAA